MRNTDNHITVFEHEILRFDRGERRITESQYKALQSYYGNGVPYFSLCYNGVKFCEYVGVIQVGKTTIEVLPKADKNTKSEDEENKWRDILIDMLRAVGTFDVKSTSQSNLKVKANNILDLYFELFLKEVEFLLHNGLIKKYRSVENNSPTLKGSLVFSKQIQQNLIHQERFYIRHTYYDTQHLHNQIIFKTIKLLQKINTNNSLHSRIGALLLNFPEMCDVKVTEATFEKITYNRKTQPYQKAIEIAKLLLLKHHPDVSQGSNDVLALMFDMNLLWEQFVYVSLKRGLHKDTTIYAQNSKLFWVPKQGYSVSIRPDIVINSETEQCIVLDTKWKNLNGKNPSSEDLRQMYVYSEYFQAKQVNLIYPSTEDFSYSGKFEEINNEQINRDSSKECFVIGIKLQETITAWMEEIAKNINKINYQTVIDKP